MLVRKLSLLGSVHPTAWDMPLHSSSNSTVKISQTLKMWEECGRQGDTTSGFAPRWGKRPTDGAFVKGCCMKPWTTNGATSSTLTVKHFCKSQIP